MDFDLNSFARTLARVPSPKRWLVGFSGGLDSTVLLHALVAYRRQNTSPAAEIIALHVNHGLAAEAELWQCHCELIAEQLGVKFVSEPVQVASKGSGVEAAARHARYDVFAHHMCAGDVLLLAHHLDDQAETLLYRLMRGAGPRGLAAMPQQRRFADGELVRPLLDFSRQSLLQYAQTQQLQWLDDPSNSDEHFDRNYLRQSVLPLLTKRWPHYAERCGQTARLCREADELNRDLAREDLTRAEERSERLGVSVDFSCVLNLSHARRHNLIRYWVEQHQLAMPEVKHLLELDQQFFSGSLSPEAQVTWGRVTMAAYEQRLYLLPQLAPPNTKVNVPWSVGQQSVTLPDGSVLSYRASKADSLAINAKLFERPVCVRWRQGGERCQPNDRAHSQTLKKLLQEYHIAPWLRDRVPLVYVDGEIVAVGDYWVCRSAAAKPSESGVVFEWHYPNPTHP